MSWLWTLSLVYHLYGVATTKALPSKWSIRYTHIVCWGLPIVLFAIEIPFTPFIRSQPGFEVCDLGSLDAAIYHAFAYYLLLLAIMIAFAVFSYKTAQLEKNEEPGYFHPSYVLLKDSVRLYPTAMVICWTPHLILYCFFFLIDSNPVIYKGFYFSTSVLKVLHGFVTACIFFYKSKSARRLWVRKFHDLGLARLCCCLRWFKGNNGRIDSKSTIGEDGENRLTLSLIDRPSSNFV